MIIKPGTLLISEPYLPDPNFSRSVVLITEHTDEGTIGFVLNQKTEYQVADVMNDFGGFQAPIYVGGPVMKHTLHYLHNLGMIFKDTVQISKDLYWGGDFQQLKTAINSGKVDPSQIRFYAGYSGWMRGQLTSEIAEKAWIISDYKPQYLWDLNPEELWRSVLKDKGEIFKVISNFPEDPSLN